MKKSQYFDERIKIIDERTKKGGEREKKEKGKRDSSTALTDRRGKGKIVYPFFRAFAFRDGYAFA